MPKTLFGPFGDTHPVRAKVREEFLTASESWDFFEGYITPTDFNRLSAQYQYVACVRGNGIDTHRFWETLYRGRIPIVMEDDWSKSLNHLNLPFESISSWEKSELSRVILKSYVQVQPKQISSLWMPYWLNFIKDKLG